jgi:hypothetical protein
MGLLACVRTLVVHELELYPTDTRRHAFGNLKEEGLPEIECGVKIWRNRRNHQSLRSFELTGKTSKEWLASRSHDSRE